MADATTLLDMPECILELIFDHLDMPSLAAVACTCSLLATVPRWPRIEIARGASHTLTQDLLQRKRPGRLSLHCPLLLPLSPDAHMSSLRVCH
jgi:hypothetical protein